MATIGRVVPMGISSLLHAAFVVFLVLTPLSRPRPEPPAALRTVAVVALPRPSEPTAADAIAENLGLDAESGEDRTLPMPGGAIDVSRIEARQQALFPLLTEGLTLLDDIREAAARRDVPDERLRWFTHDNAAASARPPLRLSDAEMTRLVDRAWSRRERWRSFVEIARLLTEHDPDAGHAADLVRLHLDRNMLQPYRATTPADARFWVMLNMAADQELIIRFVTRFVREHPSTRTSTELLFFLDELTQANGETLLILLDTIPQRDLTSTRGLDPQAYQLAEAIHGHYLGWLRERDLLSETRISRRYDDIRTHILSTILETTPEGYGAADARYLLGRIRWDENRTAEAMDWWRGMAPDQRGLYAPIYARILPEVLGPGDGSAARITAALGAEILQWRRFSEARLRQFGYTGGVF